MSAFELEPATGFARPLSRNLGTMLPEIDETYVATKAMSDVALESELRLLERDCQAMQDIAELHDTLQGATTNLQPVALRVASESLRTYARHFEMEKGTLGFARESFSEMIKGASLQARDALIAKAKAALGSAAVAIGKRLRNVLERLKITLRMAFRFDETWTKEVRGIVSRAKSMRGIKPRQDVFFTNRVKVAHFTDGNFEVHTEASSLTKEFETTYHIFRQVGVFMREFKKIFDLRNERKGEFDFRPLGASLRESQFSTDRYTLSGNLAIFGEEFSVSEVSGIATNVETMMMHARQINFDHENIWKLGDLRQPRLAPMSADHIIREGEALLYIADMVRNQAERWQDEIGYYESDAYDKIFSSFWRNLDFWKSPKNFILYAGAYSRCVTGFASVLGGSITNQAAALLCLGDYYKWSLDQHEMD